MNHRYTKAAAISLTMLITSGIFYFAAGLMGSGNDVSWHTLNGLQMLQSHKIILKDALTWKTPGHSWSDPEWLFDLFLALIYSKFGWFGVRTLVVILGELLMLVIVTFAISRQKISIIIPLALFLGTSLIPVYTARPQIVSYLMFALGIYVIEIARRDRWSKLLVFIPAFIIWNNSHGSAVLFLGLLLLEWFTDHKIWPYILTYLALIMIRPGTSLELARFMQQQLSPIAMSIPEWQSPNFHIPVELIELAFFAFSCFLIFEKITMREKSWLFFGWLAYFISVRFYAYAAILTWFILIKHLKVPKTWDKTMPLISSGLAIVMLCQFPMFFHSKFYEPVESGAAQYCLDHGLKNVVNEYSIGGGLEWYGLKTIGDGRALWIGEKWFSTYFDMGYGKYPIRKFLTNEAPDVDAVVWLDDSGPAQQMDLMTEWFKVYDDKSVSVWKKQRIIDTKNDIDGNK